LAASPNGVQWPSPADALFCDGGAKSGGGKIAGTALGAVPGAADPDADGVDGGALAPADAAPGGVTAADATRRSGVLVGGAPGDDAPQETVRETARRAGRT
jgi:hypothetical protein